MDVVQNLFGPGGFEPHGQCLLWDRALLWLHVLSDTVITLSYYSIPLALVSFVRKRHDLPFNWMFHLFGAFIFACGTTHLMAIWTIWRPVYWLDGAVKLATAGISLATAFLIWPLIPKALALPSPSQYEAINRDLRRENAERRQAEIQAQLRAAQLEAANRELESFSYSVSHDLRAPVRHIDGFAQMLKRHAGHDLDEQARRYLETISASAKHMGRLIDDLLAFSRTGRAELRKIDVNVNEMVADVIRELELETQGRRIDWAIQPMPTVRADAAMLRQVFMNVLSNAVKYTRPRPCARIEVGCDANEEEDVFFVRDNGVGFDRQYADRLFGVFERLHRADEFEGTGIGLAHVRRIVLRHGGRTWAEGAVDEGATVYFSVPKTSDSENEDADDGIGETKLSRINHRSPAVQQRGL